MKAAKFLVENTFMLTSRGFVVSGKILDNKSISMGDWALIEAEGKWMRFEILGVESIYSGTRGPEKPALIFSMEDGNLLKSMNLCGVEIGIESEAEK